MQILKIGLLAALLTLAGTASASAAPLVVALFGAAFAATTAGAIVAVVFSAVISVGVSLLAQALLKKEASATADPGIQFEVQMGDTVPIGFPIGETATAGSREYIGAWGEEGGTPNAYLVDVLSISDIPLPGQPGLWLGDTKCTILWDDTPTEAGYPIEEFRVSGKDHAWIKYNDGTQTEVDPYLLDKFGLHPEHPWTSDMIGVGVAHLIATTLVNRELFSGEPRKLIEPPVAHWYDVRKDSTAGGSGDHRWGEWDTYEPSTNAKVLEYNILRGVYYGSEWLFGGQNLPAFRLPAANWIAAQNACDEAIETTDGEEPAFRAGMYVTGDLEPLQVVEELRKASNSRTAEDGGIFRTQVGLPGSAVYSFTDGDVLVTEGQSYEPFPNLDSTNNIVEAVYPDPREMWRDKDAPVRRNDAAIEEDGGRELPASVRFTAAPYPFQVQRLQLAQSQDDRRFRVHSITLPPDAWPLSAAVDTVSWTSTRNGYSNKKFVILKIAGKRNSCQSVLLKEVDAGDFDWDEEYELPESVGVIGPLPIPAQPMTGWQVFPAYQEDSTGSRKSSTIRVHFDGDQADVGWVQVQARVKATAVVAFDAQLPYADVPEVSEGIKAVVLNGVFLPETIYEVRGKFIPFSARPTEWSEWLEVETPPDPQESVQAVVEERATLVLEELRVATDHLAALVAEQDAANAIDKLQTVREFKKTLGQAQAYFNEQINLSVGPGSAAAQALIDLGASIGNVEANLKIRYEAAVDTEGAIARYQMVATAEDVVAGFEVFVVSGPGGPVAQVAVTGNTFYVKNGDGSRLPFFIVDTLTGATYINGDIIASGSITAAKLAVSTLSSITANIGSVTAGIIQDPAGLLVINLSAPSIVISQP